VSLESETQNTCSKSSEMDVLFWGLFRAPPVRGWPLLVDPPPTIGPDVFHGWSLDKQILLAVTRVSLLAHIFI